MAVIWEEEESDTWIMEDETIIWEDKQSDMWMIEDDTIIWEDEDNDAWMLEHDIMDMIRSIILDIINQITA